MTTLNQARTAVYQRFMAEWVGNDNQPLTPYCFGNEALDNHPEWARCLVVSLPNSQETLGAPGNRKFKRRAMAQVGVYTAPGSGMSRSDQLVKVAMDMFEGRSLLGTAVKFFEASSVEAGVVEMGRWFLSSVTAHFDYEEIR